MLGWADDVARVNSYDVKINAPKQVDDLLESYLDVYRWRKQKKIWRWTICKPQSTAPRKTPPIC